MTSYSKRERLEAVLKGETPDRVPVSAWRHFLDDEQRADTLAAASLANFREFDWDWLKVNPRATYYAEAWGNQYDYARYDSVIPALIDGPLRTPTDLDKIGRVSGTAGVFAEQLDVTRLVKAGIGDAHFLQTVFSPLSVLSFLVARPEQRGIENWSAAQYAGVQQFIRANPAGAHAALTQIADTLAEYAAALIETGASGIFFAIVKLAREGILSEAEHATFGRPYDLRVLEAVQGAPFNLLHICGPTVYFDAVLDYPVHALNWATLGQHNPTLAEARLLTDKTLVGGIDELGALQTGSPEAVSAEAARAIQGTKGQKLLLTPGCGTAVDVPSVNLQALRTAAHLASPTGA